MDLTTKMKRYLPLYAYPTPALHETLRKLNTPTDAKLEITDVMDSGESLGGITCGIHGKDEVISSTLIEGSSEIKGFRT